MSSGEEGLASTHWLRCKPQKGEMTPALAVPEHA